MTDEDRKLIHEYMKWCYHKYATSGKLWGTGICIKCKKLIIKGHPLDGNDMVAAMNKISENKDWGSSHLSKLDLILLEIMQPTKFFELMAEWLRRRNGQVE